MTYYLLISNLLHFSLIYFQIQFHRFANSLADGSMVNASKAACGGLLRDASGGFVSGFSANLGVCPITIAEVWGAFYDLSSLLGTKVFALCFWS